ncbi:hypothetical protein ES703_17717 [subsurface metagenome]
METLTKGNGHRPTLRSFVTRLLLGSDIAEMLQGYVAPQGKHNSLITGSPTSWTWGKGDHGAELNGLEDDDHTQYHNNARHDLPARHTLGTVVPHDNLADLAEKAHASLTGVNPDDHHAKYTDLEAQNTVKANVEVGDLKAPTKVLDMNSQKITGLATPTAGSDAATKDLVDSMVQGLDWQPSVLGELDTPPGSPTTGDRYLVIATATGDWVGHEDDIAEWDGSVWDFTAPGIGFAVWIEDVGRQKNYNGTVWVLFGTTVDHGNLLGLGDDDHAQYLNNTRHDVVARHGLGTVVPHDNLGDLAEKAHSSLTGVNPDDHHTKTGDYEVFPLTELVASLPSAAVGNVGRIMRERTGAGQVSKAFMCVQNSGETYEWVQVAIST